MNMYISSINKDRVVPSFLSMASIIVFSLREISVGQTLQPDYFL